MIIRPFEELGTGGFKSVYTGLYESQQAALAFITADKSIDITELDWKKDSDTYSPGRVFLSVPAVKKLDRENEIHEKLYETKMGTYGLEMGKSLVPQIFAKHKRYAPTSADPNSGKRGVLVYVIIMERGVGDLIGYWNAYAKIFDFRGIRGQALALMMTYGVELTHRAGYINRDMKPDNIIVSLDGRAMVSDFGTFCARDGNSAELRTEVGTKDYLGQEKIASISKEKLDIYALGKSFSVLTLDPQEYTGRPRDGTDTVIGRWMMLPYHHRPLLSHVRYYFALDLVGRLCGNVQLRKALQDLISGQYAYYKASNTCEDAIEKYNGDRSRVREGMMVNANLRRFELYAELPDLIQELTDLVSDLDAVQRSMLDLLLLRTDQSPMSMLQHWFQGEWY